jgi:hypothetical protein
MRSLLRAFVVALVAVCALGAAASASASAPPRFVVAKGGSYPITAEASAPSAFAVISQETGEAHSCHGVDSQITIPAPGSTASYAIELQNCKLVSGLACATEGSAGERLSGTATLVYINRATKLVGLLVTLTPTEILCGTIKEKVKGSILAPITPINKETTSLGLSFTGNGAGKPTYTTYENEKGETSKAKLEVNPGTGYKAAALETEAVTLSTTEANGVIVQAETSIPPENTGLPVVSPTTPVQGTLEAATRGIWANEPTSYTYQWERCNAAGEGCEPISGASGSKYTPVAGDVGHALVVEVTAKNEFGWSSARSKATGAVLAAGKPEFVLGEGSVFPDAFEGGAPAAKVSISNPVEALTCEGATARGSLTGAKSLSLTLELKRCANASEECKTPGAGAGVEILSGTGGLFYIAKAEKRAGVPFALTATEIVCGTLKVKVRGTIVIPITPLNAKTTKLALPFTGNGSGKATYTTYENEKGEVIKAKLEANFGSGYKESALELAETLEPTASEALTITA